MWYHSWGQVTAIHISLLAAWPSIGGFLAFMFVFIIILILSAIFG